MGINDTSLCSARRVQEQKIGCLRFADGTTLVADRKGMRVDKGI